MIIKYLGHSAFEIKTANRTILIDPFLILSPNYDYSSVTDIFVTHGHADHLGSAIEISKATGAKITAIFELANYCSSKGAYVNGINLSGKMTYEWGNVIAVPAFHSSSTPEGDYAGCACGFVFKIENRKIYHAGDTCINSEMKIIGDLYSPEISILPIGGHYTMDINQAVIASAYLNSTQIIPMHYNTFEAISINIAEFEKKILELNKEPVVLKVGETFELLYKN